MQADKLMLIDGNSILNRAFYGLQGSQLLSNADGLYTNAIFGFLNILLKFLEEEKPQYLCVAFDLKAPTFRHKEFAGYKAQRKGMPDELRAQVPVMKEVLDAMKIKRLEVEGYEADDILGSVSLCAQQQGKEVVIVTGDRDSLQLASDTTRIKLPITRGGKTETEEYDSRRVMEKYGVTPQQFIDVKGLMGDPSDNIPGVPGIGEKTALDLIQKLGSMDHIYEDLEQVERKSVREKLEANRELAFMSRRLATIDRSVPGLCGLDELKRTDYDRQALYPLFKKLEFKSLIDRLGLEAQTPSKDESQAPDCTTVWQSLQGLKEKITAAGSLAIYYLINREGALSFKFAGVALCWEKGNSCYLDLTDQNREEEFLHYFAEIFRNPEIHKYGHDMKNLLVYLRDRGIEMQGLAFDTMIAAYLINPSRETYTVSELVGEYLNRTVISVEEMAGKGKSHLAFSQIPLEKIAPAAGASCQAVVDLREKLEEMLSENQQEELYYNIELPMAEALADMEYHGFKINVEALRAFSSELEARIETLMQEIFQLAGESFNINSTKQLGVILFEKLGLPVVKKTKTGYSTDAEVLEELSDRHEIISRILEYRQMVKLKSTYVEGLLGVMHPTTCRIHSIFRQTVAVTGRISSTEPNLQNIPIKLELGRKIRKVFVPDSEEYVLLDADYSQIELRVLAHITGDENMSEAFRNNEDIHTSTAAQVFGIPKDQVTSLMRSRAKAVNFGIVYGIGDFSLAKDLGITRKEARHYIEQYLDKYPRVRQYMHDIVEEGKNAGYVTTLFNRRRYLPELKSSNFNLRSFGERIAMNTPIQGSAADIIKIAMVRVYKELKKRGLRSRLILQVHDELIIETHREEKEEVAALLKQSMEGAARLSIPLTVEVKEGSNWYETK